MKVIITGGFGQLGRALVAQENQFDGDLLAFDSCDLDITNHSQIHTVFEKVRPDAVIHTGAYTAVDAAEAELDQAFRVNVLGTRNIAAACLHYACKMVYISTDYVFDGRQRSPYTEFDLPNPLNAYGRSKWEGERIAARICPRLFTVRTSWLYGEGHNFVRTILRLAKERESIKVVYDQTGTPTSTADLAQAILALVTTEAFGTYHMSNNGCCSWFDFAGEIIRLAGLSTRIEPITSAEFPAVAQRPTYSVLRNYMLELSGGDPFRSWRDALADYLQAELGRM